MRPGVPDRARGWGRAVAAVSDPANITIPARIAPRRRSFTAAPHLSRTGNSDILSSARPGRKGRLNRFACQELTGSGVGAARGAGRAHRQADLTAGGGRRDGRGRGFRYEQGDGGCARVGAVVGGEHVGAVGHHDAPPGVRRHRRRVERRDDVDHRPDRGGSRPSR